MDGVAALSARQLISPTPPSRVVFLDEEDNVTSILYHSLLTELSNG